VVFSWILTFRSNKDRPRPTLEVLTGKSIWLFWFAAGFGHFSTEQTDNQLALDTGCGRKLLKSLCVCEALSQQGSRFWEAKHCGHMAGWSPNLGWAWHPPLRVQCLFRNNQDKERESCARPALEVLCASWVILKTAWGSQAPEEWVTCLQSPSNEW
jgi:hypothetical protein